jgi:cysteine-rich repeat protein
MFALLAGCESQGQDQPPAGVTPQRAALLPWLGEDIIPPLSACSGSTTVQTDIVYSTRSTWNKFDYYPCNPTNPTVVFIHGGGWWTGDKALPPSATTSPNKEVRDIVLNELVARGFNVVSANYRLTRNADGSLSGVIWPQPLNDIKCLLTFMAVQAPNYGDHRNIILWGHSAGGHLAAMAAYTSSAQFDEGAGCGSSTTGYRVSRLVAGSAPMDLSNPSTGVNQDDIKRLLGTSTWTSADIAKATAASPKTYVTDTAPMTLLLTGATDALVVPSKNAKLIHDAFAGWGRTDRWVNYVIPSGTNAHNGIYSDILQGNGSPAEANARSQIRTFLTPVSPFCGDGFVTTPQEVCDDGNTHPCGTCSSDCQSAQPATAATGSITALPSGNIADGVTLTLKDGANSTVFEFDKNNAITAGRVRIALASSQTAGTVATQIRSAVNGVGSTLKITASGSGSTVSLLNDQAGSFGNQAITHTHPAMTVSGMYGGKARDCFIENCTSSEVCAPNW